jgi:hypothetical protein
MPDTLGHDNTKVVVTAIASLPDAEHPCNVFALRRFFTQKHLHKFSGRYGFERPSPSANTNHPAANNRNGIGIVFSQERKAQANASAQCCFFTIPEGCLCQLYPGYSSIERYGSIAFWDNKGRGDKLLSRPPGAFSPQNRTAGMPPMPAVARVSSQARACPLSTTTTSFHRIKL